MIKTLLKTLLLLAVLGYLVFALIKISRPTDEMVCTGVEYILTDSSDMSLVNKDIVDGILTRNKISPKGKTLADIDIDEIEHKLSQASHIDTAQCYHTASGKLCIKITPAHPILHIFSNDGDEFYIDQSGHVIEGGGMNTDLCIVTGQVNRQYASTKLVTLGKILQEDPYWNQRTQQVNITEKGYIELIPNICQQKVLLGEPKDIAGKLERVRMFYEKAMPKAGWNKYNLINAMYSNQIIATKE